MLENGVPPHNGRFGEATTRNMIGEYTAYLHNLVDLSRIRRLRVAVDAATIDSTAPP
jgi:phosphomannomutase